MAAAFALAAALVVSVPPERSFGQTTSRIDLTGATSRENCAPCHLSIAETRRPGLLFSHGTHLMIGCTACHYSQPHEGGGTVRPDMKACFACHGVLHPQGEIAVADCAECHTPSFKLRPKSHTKDYAKRPHALESAKTGVNDCMMCHTSVKDCDDCHERLEVRKADGSPVGRMPAIYQSVVPAPPAREPYWVSPTEPTKMSQCVFCHPDIDRMSAATARRLIFTHEPHLEQNHQCAVCHPEFGHGPQTIRRPDMLSCYRCHGLVHSAQGLAATDKCEACHPKGFPLKPPDHTKAFEKGKHKTKAIENESYCAMCHKATFCVECHSGKKKGSKPVIPADHRKREWREKHGGLFLAQKGSCGSCHDSKSCKRCHKTVMPHPSDWLKNHGLEKGIPKEDCYVCHTDRSYCQECHHKSVGRQDLIAKNCTPCHPEMKLQPPTSIKNKGFAEHAVHFRVAKAFGGPKPRPYVCDDCHIGFGRVTASAGQAAMGGSLPNAAHDVRLCYLCHGNLDYRNRIIAPYAGAELCRRCHSDLKF